MEFRDLLTKELTFVATQLARLLRHHGPRLLAAEALSELVAVGCGHFPAHVAALAGAHAAPVHGAGNLVEIGPQVRTLARGHLGPLADAWRLDLLTVVPETRSGLGPGHGGRRTASEAAEHDDGAVSHKLASRHEICRRIFRPSPQNACAVVVQGQPAIWRTRVIPNHVRGMGSNHRARPSPDPAPSIYSSPLF